MSVFSTSHLSRISRMILSHSCKSVWDHSAFSTAVRPQGCWPVSRLYQPCFPGFRRTTKDSCPWAEKRSQSGTSACLCCCPCCERGSFAWFAQYPARFPATHSSFSALELWSFQGWRLANSNQPPKYRHRGTTSRGFLQLRAHLLP